MCAVVALYPTDYKIDQQAKYSFFSSHYSTLLKRCMWLATPPAGNHKSHSLVPKPHPTHRMQQSQLVLFRFTCVSSKQGELWLLKSQNEAISPLLGSLLQLTRANGDESDWYVLSLLSPFLNYLSNLSPSQVCLPLCGEGSGVSVSGLRG